VIDAVGKPAPDPDGYLRVFFTASAASQRAGQETLQRIFSRPDPDAPTNWQTRQSQYDAVCEWGEPNHALLQRVGAIQQPVFIANGDSDPMILPHYSYLLAGLIPHAGVKLYPDAAHGFLFQHHDEFAADVEAFLAAWRAGPDTRPLERGGWDQGADVDLADEHERCAANRRGAWTCPRRSCIHTSGCGTPCFIAMGLRRTVAAAGELRALFRGQWANGCCRT
jgi:hypothetical protein